MKPTEQPASDRLLELKIGIFRALKLGDMLSVIPAVRAIRHAFPIAHITLIGLPWEEKLVSRFSHYFNGFVSFPGWPGLPEQEIAPVRMTDFLRQMQHLQLDLLLQMQGDGSYTNAMCLLCGAKQVAGLRLKRHAVPGGGLFPVFRENEHEVLRFLRLVKEALGIDPAGTALEFPVMREEYEEAGCIMEVLGLTPGKYICLHPGARDPRRRWEPAKFAVAGDRLARAGFHILLTGDRSERDITRQVASLMHYPAADLVAGCGQVDLGVLAALIEQGAGLLCNDTGVSHLAAALEVPSVVVFSPYSSAARWAPLDHTLHMAVAPEAAADPEKVACRLLRCLSRLPATASVSGRVSPDPVTGLNP
ncbi:glycosyltransferase family 9 protein [Compostibacter hankyongensis]|uniref:Glycosyltransferase family 9 protein n=1 Tax=Compostibacter hankyongensis TaxID=1007089 RepID=A0ABP8FW66_9BACT